MRFVAGLINVIEFYLFWFVLFDFDKVGTFLMHSSIFFLVLFLRPYLLFVDFVVVENLPLNLFVLL